MVGTLYTTRTQIVISVRLMMTLFGRNRHGRDVYLRTTAPNVMFVHSERINEHLIDYPQYVGI